MYLRLQLLTLRLLDQLDPALLVAVVFCVQVLYVHSHLINFVVVLVVHYLGLNPLVVI